MPKISHIHNSSPYIEDEWERQHAEAVRRHGRKADAVIVVIGVVATTALLAAWIVS